MRVLHAAHNHPGFHAGGTEIFAKALNQTLNAAESVESRFLGVALPLHREANPGTAFVADPSGGEDWVMAGGRFEAAALSQIDSFGFLKGWERLLEDWSPDVVHFHHVLMLGAEAIMVARRVLPKARLVMTLHDFYPICMRDGLMLRTDGALCEAASNTACARCFPETGAISLRLRELHIRRALEVIDAYVAPSRFLMERYRAWGLDSARLVHVRNGHRRSALHGDPPAVEAGRPVRFGFFGHLNHAKGAVVALRAARLLLRRGVDRFQIVLHGSAAFAGESVRAEVDSLVAELGAHAAARGAYAQEDAVTLMQRVDCVLVPSLWWENDPLVIQEAFAARRPVLCSDIGGMAERVTHETDGLHVPVGDDSAWADAMERVIREPELATRLGAATTAPVSMDACAQAYRHVYGAP